jgi:hypothetical protein
LTATTMIKAAAMIAGTPMRSQCTWRLCRSAAR